MYLTGELPASVKYPQLWQIMLTCVQTSDFRDDEIAIMKVIFKIFSKVRTRRNEPTLEHRHVAIESVEFSWRAEKIECYSYT